MFYENLQHRYGNHVAQRVRQELTAAELRDAAIDTLPDMLEHRAELAEQAYRRQAANPTLTGQARSIQDERLITLYRNWQDAEDLAYLLTIAEDVRTRSADAVAR